MLNTLPALEPAFDRITPFNPARAEALPPHSIASEQGLLGCLLLDPPGVIRAAEQCNVQADHFYDLRHRAIYSTIRQMLREGAHVDLITLMQRFHQQGHAEQVGGIHYLSSLDSCTPSAANAPYYIEILEEQLARRRMLDTADQLSTAVRASHVPVRVLLNGAEQTLRGFACNARYVLNRIAVAARQQNFAMVIIDPVYKLYGDAEENNASDVARLLNQMEALTQRGDVAVVFGAHFSKGNQAAKEALDRISGSGVFVRDPDTCLMITPHEEKGAYTVEARLRNHPPFDPFAVRWSFPLFQRDCGLDPARLQGRGAEEIRDAETQVLELLPETGLKHAEWLAIVHKKLRIAESTFYRVRRQLLTKGRIRLQRDLYVPSDQ